MFLISPVCNPSPLLEVPLSQSFRSEVGMTLHAKIQVVLNRRLAQEASTLAYHDMFILMALIVLLAAIPVVWLRHRRVSA